MTEKYKFKNEDYPMELILCPFCCSRLNRVNCEGNLVPTSCIECNKHNFKPKIIFVKEVIKNDI